MRTLSAKHQTWKLKKPFSIARGTKYTAETLYVEITQGNHIGRGEALPYQRYGETIQDAISEITKNKKHIETITDKNQIKHIITSKAAQNAIDCALWDLEAAIQNKPVWEIAQIPKPKKCTTAYTISLDTPEIMAENTKIAAQKYPLLKIKLGSQDGNDQTRIIRVRQAAPDARIIIDANEGWKPENIMHLLNICEKHRIELVEQPLPEKNDDILNNITPPNNVLICADESVHNTESLSKIIGKYQAVNIKLDKTGGFSEALKLYKKAKEHKLKIMAGCMIASSLSIAPAAILATQADFIDLDAPLMLKNDQTYPIQYQNDIIYPPPQELWGYGKNEYDNAKNTSTQNRKHPKTT